MNSNSIHTPLRPVSLQNLNPGKFWTNTSISGWVDSIYSQSEVYIKHERELKEEELKQQQQQTGIGSSEQPIDLDGMDIARNNNNNNNNNNSANNSTNNSTNNSSNMNMNLNNININSNNTTTTTTSSNTK